MYRISRSIMPVLRILILIFISRAASVDFSMTKNANNYGPYTTKFYNYKLCQGPRSKNVTIASTTLDVDKYGAIGNYNVTFTVPAKLDVFKVAVWNVKGDQKNLLWNYKVNNPCQHFVITGILEQTFREMHNCVIPPGNYNYKANYTNDAYLFFGSSFFYGDYSFKINAIAKQGNVMCIQINALFSRKV